MTATKKDQGYYIQLKVVSPNSSEKKLHFRMEEIKLRLNIETLAGARSWTV